MNPRDNEEFMKFYNEAIKHMPVEERKSITIPWWIIVLVVWFAFCGLLSLFL